ncbi:MAG: hypothetical protein AAGF87_07540 [Bacteroidota bacterium]
METVKYYKINWEDESADQYVSWGKLIWYFEVDSEDYAIRQIEKYENSRRLKYDLANIGDEFGGLGDQPFDMDEFMDFEIIKDEFEEQWK